MNKWELARKLEALSDRFLEPHLAKADLTTDEEDDIRAFCVLSHAALEEYIETFASDYRERLLNRWTTGIGLRKLAVVSLISFVVSQGKTFKIENESDEKNSQTAPIHQIRTRLAESQTAHANLVDSNHGASKSYIRGLLVPLGFGDVSDHTVMDAISKLANNRGSYAHRVNHSSASKFVLNKMSASQLKALIPDIVRLDDELVARAREALPADYPPFSYDLFDVGSSKP